MSASLASLLAFGLTGSDWLTVVVFFAVVTQLTIFSVTLYLHRCAAHRGVDMHPVLSHFFRFWAWLTTAMRTKEWVAIHRKHHAHCETENDPHSPAVYGINRVVLHGVALYQDEAKVPETMEKYGIGTPDDWIERHLYHPRNAWGPTLMLFIDVALFGAVGITIWALQMIWIPVMAAGVINGLGHWWGYRNFETSDMSTNLTPWALFLGGEELHNNHHAFPSSAKFALRRYELDIGWGALRLFEMLGLAKVLRVAPQLETRAIDAPDAETLRAVLAHRFHVMTTYFRGVMLPILREEAQSASDRMQRVTRRLRRALASDGRWLDAGGRERLAQWIEQRPMVATVVEYRRRLSAVLERSGKSSDAVLEGLREWCRDAERSGIDTLQQFAQVMRGYALKPVRARDA
jgi:stearoyl-CoA desaturase (delta-9 desaturase)